MSETTKKTVQSWLPVVLTLAMLLTSLGFRGGAADHEIKALRLDLAELKTQISQATERQREQVAEISEKLVKAEGYRDGLQTRLTILEKRVEDDERRHAEDQRADQAEFATHRSLIENNKTAVRVTRGLFEQHVHGTVMRPDEEGGDSP